MGGAASNPLTADSKVDELIGDKTDVAEICADMFAKAAAIVATNPGNRCTKYLCDATVQEEVGKLDLAKLKTFMQCVITGIVNPDSGLGCYAMNPGDYNDFSWFFDKVIGDYHKNDAAFAGSHETDWTLDEDLTKYDLSKAGLEEELSMRVRVGRNLKNFPLPGAMTKDDRVNFEMQMDEAFTKIKETFGGTVHSMSPDWNTTVDGAVVEKANPNLITAEKYQELVDAHVMFKDMDADAFLKVAGISSDWPYGRGCWQSECKQKIIWFGEEDQLRIMCMKKGMKLDEIFSGLNTLLKTIEEVPGIEFATHERFGYVTSCPSNLGTGMRASVHIKLPELTKDDDGHGKSANTSAIADPLGLSVRGTGGEHTPFKDATVDLSPRARLFIKESEIIAALLEGLTSMVSAEKAAAPPAGDAATPAGDAAAPAVDAAAPAGDAPAAE